MATANHQAKGKPKAIFLMGPTACGKTDLAIALHRHLPVEIISVDSAMVYRGLDIGSAKPGADELARAPHRLIDICDPATPYSAAQFILDARKEMAEITASGRVPLLVGGTMLYFKALLEGLAEAPASDPAIRQAIESEATEKGWSVLHAQLMVVDPTTAAQLHPNHSQRIQRALEVYRATGVPISHFRQQHQQSGGETIGDEYDVIQLALLPHDRKVLHDRIEQRFHQMLAAGFENEVRRLYERGDLDENLPAMRAVGYRQMWNYLKNQTQSDASGYDDMVEKGVIATRQLAKRQLTWLRKWQELNLLWLDNEHGELNHPEDILTNSLKIIEKEPI